MRSVIGVMSKVSEERENVNNGIAKIIKKSEIVILCVVENN